MKVRWLGKTEALILTTDKIYDVISIERGWYRVIDVYSHILEEKEDCQSAIANIFE